MSLDVKKLQTEIRDQYLIEDNQRPWVVAFSGGKDSTLLLQLVWYTLTDIPAQERKRQVYVVCNNTLVENPKVIEYVNRVLRRIEEAAEEQSMPVTVTHTTPALEDTFWVNLIGKGYPAPNNVFRWCTERLKISPTTRFITDKIKENGEVILLLGTRRDESSNRAKSIKKQEIKGQRLNKHSTLPNAYVYAAIKDIGIDDLWQYLQQVKSPWGSNNKELVSLYKNASGGDCPLVVDKSTPSCGNSRFGCWVCTVVKRDKSMEALIEHGEEWMEPLMELRDLLAKSRDSEEDRQKQRRDGTVKEGILGPYKPDFRAKFLRLLLEAQKEIQNEQKDIALISYQELCAIQVLWHRDNIFNHSVADVYNGIYSTSITFGDAKVIKEKDTLKQFCKDNPEDFKLINELLVLQKNKILLMNSRGLQNDLENHVARYISSE